MVQSKQSGALVAFEGLGGSGKTTAAGGLAAWLASGGVSVVTTHEPGATALGSQLRGLLLEASPPPVPWAEAFLFEADRAQAYAERIIPALCAGKLVVADRNVSGTVAYQAFGRGLDIDLVDRMSRAATAGYWPDLVFVLDIDPMLGLQRKRGQGATDRFDAEDLAFQRRVRDGYLFAARRDGDRAHVVDGSQPADAVLAEIQGIVVDRLHDHLPPVLRTAFENGRG